MTLVQRLESCHLDRWQICIRNPIVGARLETIVKQSLEHSIAKQHLRGTVRLTQNRRENPDILVDLCERHHLAVDCRHWTATKHRHGKIYLSREFYGTQRRGKPSLNEFLEDRSRLLLIVFELLMVDTSTGKRHRKLFFVPGWWLDQQFKQQPGISIDLIASAWPSFGKNRKLRYEIDVWKLVEMADEWELMKLAEKGNEDEEGA